MVIVLLRVGICSCASNHKVWGSAACAAEWMNLVPLPMSTRLPRQGSQKGRAKMSSLCLCDTFLHSVAQLLQHCLGWRISSWDLKQVQDLKCKWPRESQGATENDGERGVVSSIGVHLCGLW